MKKLLLGLTLLASISAFSGQSCNQELPVSCRVTQDIHFHMMHPGNKSYQMIGIKYTSMDSDGVISEKTLSLPNYNAIPFKENDSVIADKDELILEFSAKLDELVKKGICK